MRVDDESGSREARKKACLPFGRRGDWALKRRSLVKLSAKVPPTNTDVVVFRYMVPIFLIL